MTKKLLILFMFYASIISAQWIQQESNNSEKLTDVIMLDSATAIAVGDWNSILKTTDAGKTWRNLALPLSSIIKANSISFIDKNVGSIACDYGVVTTINQLESWQWKLILPTQRCLSVLQLDYSNIYTGTDSGWIYISNDSGKTWTSEKIGDQPIRSLFYRQGVYIFGLPIFALAPLSLYVNQEFPEGQWSSTQLPLYGLGSEVFSGIYSKNGYTGFIVGTQGELLAAPLVLRKKISDTTWQVLNLNIHIAGILYGVSVPSETAVYACGTNGMIINSSDGGDTWALSEVPTSLNLNAISFYDETHGFAVGDSGVILYTSNGGLTNIENSEKQLPTGSKLYQNYPNPFNPTTKIKYSIPNLLGTRRGVFPLVELKVHDILGREIATLVNKEQPAGSYEVEFDASKYNLASGIYFYNLNVGSFSETRKLMLLK